MSFLNDAYRSVEVLDEPEEQVNNIRFAKAPESLPEPLSPPGGFVEPSYHIVSTTHIDRLHNAVISTLEENNVDIIGKNDPFCLECVAFKSFHRLSFRVYFFKAPEMSGTNSYFVEFQRRLGDSLMFSNLYASLTANLFRLDMVTHPKSPSKRLERLNLKFGSENELQKDHSKCLQTFLSGIESDLCDLQVPYLEGLATLTSIKGTLRSLLCSHLQKNGLEIFRKCLTSSHEDVSRCALAILAHAAEDNDSVASTITQDKDFMLKLLGVATAPCLQTRRELNRLLKCLRVSDTRTTEAS